MKRFLAMTCLIAVCMIASAMAQMSALSYQSEQDIGCTPDKCVATLSLDGVAIVTFDQQLNIVDWQNPVMSDREADAASAQVVDAYTVMTPTGVELGMTLEVLRCPGHGTETTMNHRSDYHYQFVPQVAAYSFTTARTECN